MTRKTNYALFFLLLFQILLIGYIYRPGKEAGPPVVQFFENAGPGQVVRLSIVDDEAHSIVLEKKQDKWLITSEGDLPADEEKVERLIDKLAGLQSSRVVTQTKASHERLKVGRNFIRKISFESQDDKTYNLIMGTAASYKSAHVRLEDDNTVYLVNGLSAWETMTEPSSWWRSIYVDIDRDRIDKVTLTNKHGQLTLIKDSGSGEWGLADSDSGMVDQDKALDFIDQVSRVTVNEYLGKEDHPQYGLAKPAAEVTFAIEDQAVKLLAGAQEEEADFFILKSSASPFYIKAGKYGLMPLIEMKKEDLLVSDSPSNDEAG